MVYSLRSNGRYQLIVLSCGIAGAVYVFLQNGFRGTSVKALVMAYVQRLEVTGMADSFKVGLLLGSSLRDLPDGSRARCSASTADS